MSPNQATPVTGRSPAPAAALVLHHDRLSRIDPMFRQLDAHPAYQPVREIRLVPVAVVDFYARTPA